MDRRNVKYFIFGFLMGAWLIFCLCELPELQEQQNQRIKEQEQRIITEVKMVPQYSEPEPSVPLDVNVIVQPPAVVPEEEDPPKYTDPDLILLAQLIESEGGIESYQCKLYIGSVVLNRMMHDSFPDSLRDVIFQVSEDGVHQFSVTRVRKDGTRAIDCEPSEDSLKAAAELLTYGTQLPLDVVVFYTENCHSDWVTTRETHTQVDHTIFAYAYRKRI